MLYPILKPSTWEGLRGNARAHVWLGSPSNPLVVVAYGDVPNGEPQAPAGDHVVTFAVGLGTDGLDYVTMASAYGRGEQLVWDAFENLMCEHTDFELVEAGGERMLVAGEPMAAERVLCEESMLLAHEKLDASEIAVSIARRGSFIACALDGGDYVRKTMTAVHAETFNEALDYGDEVFDHLVVFRDGLVVDLLSVMVSDDGEHVSWQLASA